MRARVTCAKRPPDPDHPVESWPVPHTSSDFRVPRCAVVLTVAIVASCRGDDATAPPVEEVPLGPMRILGSLPFDLPSGHHVREMAYDAKRNVVYLTQPERSRIAVLSLKPFAFMDPIVLPFEPGGIDMSPGGDSVLVASWTTGELGIIDVRGGTRTVVRHPLTSAQALDRRTFSVRSLSSGKALVTMRPYTWWGCDAGRFVLVDFSTNSEQILTPDLPCATDEMWIEASGNRSRVLVTMLNSCCPIHTHVFDANTTTFGPDLRLDRVPPVSADETGETWMVMNRIIKPFDQSFSGAAITIDDAVPAIGSLGPTGNDAYFFEGPSLVHVDMRRTATGMEPSSAWSVRVPLEGEGPHRLKVLADGKQVLLVTTRNVFLAGR